MTNWPSQALTCDVAVVGAGPAGVSACWPLVKAGLKVLTLDAGLAAAPAPGSSRTSLFDIRMDRRVALSVDLTGPEGSALRDVPGLSPKLRTAAGPSFTEGYREANRIEARDFQLVGALALGGLSNVWGAGVSLYDDADLGDGPVRASDLALSYVRVATRIGVSGECTSGESPHLPLHPPLPLSRACQALLTRAQARVGSPMRLGKPLNAVITRPMEERQACTLDNMCMWGCAKRSVYNAADELPLLLRHDNFELRPGFAVDSIRPAEQGYLLSGTDRSTGEPLAVEAQRVVLAAGAIPTTRLVLDLLCLHGRELPLQSSPAVSFAMLSPGKIGAPLSPQGFGLAQLTISCDLSGIGAPGTLAFGSIFEAEGVSAADLASKLPLTRIGAMGFLRNLVAALQIGLIYLPGEYGDTRLRLSRPDGEGRAILAIRGGFRDGTAATFRRLARLISIELLRCGALVLPGSTQLMAPGAEVHYGASLPMGGEFVSATGEVRGAPGVFVADGAALPRVAAKHHTFTVMANADRIGLGIARAGTG